MGMYCDVYGVEVKMAGLLAVAADEVVGGDDCGVVVISREDAMEILSVMRGELLNGWANKANVYSGDAPLSGVQDILHFAGDVVAFRQLLLWVAYEKGEEELVFA